MNKPNTKKQVQDRKQRKIGFAAAAAAMFVVGAFAADGTNETGRLDLKVKAGAEVRIRCEATTGLPDANHGENGHSEYTRIRIRPYLSAGTEDWCLYARIADEFRCYRSPESKSRKRRFPDVVFFDNLYWRQSGIFDLLDLQIGRQDMTFALTGCEWLKDTRFVLQGEYFEKGDYFADGSDGPALFGRCELSWKF